jgi:hypothetical protein
MTPIRASSVVFMCIYLSGPCGLSPVWGQSLQESLIQSFHAEIQALNTGDLEAAVSSAHEKLFCMGSTPRFLSRAKKPLGKRSKSILKSIQVPSSNSSTPNTSSLARLEQPGGTISYSPP